MTNLNVKNKDLQGENKITDEHTKNNSDIREVLIKNNLVPEEMPAEEDIRKPQRRVKKGEKEVAKGSKKLK